jgi:hypothetical protein
VSDPTPEPLQHAQDDRCVDQLDGSVVRNVYVRRVGEALDEDGQVVPLPRQQAATRTRPAKRKDR